MTALFDLYLGRVVDLHPGPALGEKDYDHNYNWMRYVRWDIAEKIDPAFVSNFKFDLKKMALMMNEDPKP